MSYMADRTDWEWMENKAVEYADTFHIEKVCDSWNNLLKSSVWYKMNRKMGYCDQASVRFVPVGSGGGMAL